MVRPDKPLTGDEETTVPHWMSAWEYVELMSLATMCGMINRPSFIHSTLHRKSFERLRRYGYVLWTYPHPTMGHPMAQIEPSPEGYALINATRS